MLWKIILSSKESCAEFLHREIMGNYGKNGRVIHFFKKTLKEKNPPKKKLWVLKKKLGF